MLYQTHTLAKSLLGRLKLADRVQVNVDEWSCSCTFLNPHQWYWRTVPFICAANNLRHDLPSLTFQAQ